MSLGEDSIFVVAPIGCEAMNIDGKTQHSLLKLPRKFKDFSLLKNEIAKKFQRQHKNVKFLIIDEMSMIGLRLMGMLEKRCEHLFEKFPKKWYQTKQKINR